ncbi:hypothetical protein TNIN_125561 [Trichonephila inaurata madagascariensis]|uniref:Uncharacterized protein n=1 Tax=Trichonephila inaurata madagascariensis TaxID=2747483 RepID=A0A8X6XUE2_9ARAC|nr:hypothetical protein TNIN_125561 [Trichonephila inaurata madagascariensis]
MERVFRRSITGKVMDCVGWVRARSHFITDGKYTRFSDWKFIHKAPLNGSPQCQQEGTPANAGLVGNVVSGTGAPKVINHCKSYPRLGLRPKAVLGESAAIDSRANLSENQVVGKRSSGLGGAN